MEAVLFSLNIYCGSILHFGSCGVKVGNLVFNIFSSPVRKYRKSYCDHPGVGVGVGVGVRVAQM